MSFVFSDGFDCYAAPADATNGYWDAGTPVAATFVAGRFAGSQAWQLGANGIALVKTSATNDAVHHIALAFRQTAAILGTTLGAYFLLHDGATTQCALVFRSDGAIILAAAGPTGTVLATYTGAVAANNTWYQFEIEVVISNTVGWMKVRKNGNTTEDFTSSLTLDTQTSANAYANKLTMGVQNIVTGQQIDDLYWRSDASSVAWMGDIRCYTRAPASDASVQFSRTPLTMTQTNPATTTAPLINTTARFSSFTATLDGTITTAVFVSSASVTGNMKCAIYSSVAGVPAAVLGSSGPIVAVAVGNNTFTFTPGVAVTRGQQIWVGVIGDGGGTWSMQGATSSGATAPMSYATFPLPNPTATTGAQQTAGSITYNTANNYSSVAEAQQDATTSYVYDSVPGHADLYGIAPIASTPLTTFAVTTRAYAIKSDAGTRTMAVQLKSGATTDASSTVVLTPSGWQWAWKTYTTDPATGAAWTAAAVNLAQCGPVVIA